MDALIGRLVGDGLEAELGASPPVVGGQQVALRMVAGKHGVLGAGPVPEIPTGSGSGVEGLVASAGDVAAKMDQMPLPQIAADLHAATQHLAGLAASPELAATLRHVEQASADLDRVADAARRSVPPALAKLRASVAEAQVTLAEARGMLSQTGSAAAGPQSDALPNTLYEVTRAARSMRELADFLDRHPEALVTGRGARN